MATITGTPGDDVLDGTPDPDDIYGLDGDDNLDGKAGADQLVGGAGNDSYWVDTAGDSVTELAGQGNDRVYASVSWTLGAGQSVETLLTTDSAGTAAINLTGNEIDNILIGNAGANILNGGLGRDVLIGLDGDDILIGGSGIANQMQGGRGRDVYFVSVVGDTIVELAGEGTDQVRTALSQYVLSANIEELVYIGTGNFYGVGSDGDNTIVGGAGSDSLDGGLGADNLSGGAGDDFLTGGSGAANVMAGGTGRDIYYVSAVGDSIVELAGEGNDQVRTALASFTLSANVEELVYTGTGNFSGTGNADNNIIIGGAGADTLNGGLGADIVAGGAGDDILIGGDGTANTLIGGLGRDVYFVSAVGDSVVENAGEGIDQVRTTLNRYVAAPANIEELVFIGTGDFVGTLGASGTFVAGGSGNDTLTLVTGTIRGFAGDDTIYGGTRVEGGTGNDRYFLGNRMRDEAAVVNGTRVVFENPNEGTDEILTEGSIYYLESDVENLTYVGTGSFTGYGNALANIITGGPGSDSLDGGLGADNLSGGAGDDFLTGGSGAANILAGGTGRDIYHVSAAGDSIIENAGEGNDQVRTALASFTLSANVEELVYTGNSNFAGTGNDGDNIIVGGEGADTLNGKLGADILNGGGGDDILIGGDGAANTLIGGLGRDIYFVTAVGDSVIEYAGEGQDQIRTTRNSYVLPTNVEELVFTGSGSFTGTGNALDNLILGGAGNDGLDGGDGNDTLDGGLGSDDLRGGFGNDTLYGDSSDILRGGYGSDAYVVTSANVTLVENVDEGNDSVRTTLSSYVLGANIEQLRFIGTGNFSGTGNALNNVIYGGAGDDTLNGGGGTSDQLYGGAGNDIYITDIPYYAIELANEGFDEIRTTSNFAGYVRDNIERIVYVGNGNFTFNSSNVGIEVIGGPGNDNLTGYGGNNTLRGGAGNDDLYAGYSSPSTLFGGTGDDIYHLSLQTLASLVSEQSGEGIDTVSIYTYQYEYASYTLPTNVENFSNEGGGLTQVYGNELDNYIDVQFQSGTSSGIFYGLGGNDRLRGGINSDRLEGGDGDDVITGRLGSDTLIGGSGSDRFVFDVAIDGNTGIDSLFDFAPGIDRIELSQSIFTQIAGGIVQAGAFRFGTVATEGSHRLLYDAETGILRYDPDGVGGQAAIHFATLQTNLTSLSAADFVVI